MKIKFNHKKENSLKALDIKIEKEEIHQKLNSIFANFVMRDNQKRSELAEMIHDNFDYNVILFLATSEIIEKMLLKTQSDMLREAISEIE